MGRPKGSGPHRLSWSAPTTVTRRHFLLRAGLLGAGALAGGLLQACLPPGPPRPPAPGPTTPPKAPAPTPTKGPAPTAAFDPRFGAVEAYRAREQADAAGVRWTRLVFWWSALQPKGPASWNPFYFPDDLLQAELDSGRQVVGVLINTPDWAGDGSPTSPPRGLDLPPEDQGNLWAQFARRMGERYRGRIDHWVIWNEPDIWDPASPAYTWSGSLEQFVRLQKVGYLAIKQANPGAQVGLPGLTYWWDYGYGRPQYFEHYLELAGRDPEARANNWFFDAAVLHLYNEPERLYRAPILFKELMGARGLTRPIWINETNVPPHDDPERPLPRSDFRVTRDEQASYVVQAFAMALAAGVERIAIYPFSDVGAPPDQEYRGLIGADGSPRPAYRAFQTVARYFRGAREAHIDRQGDTISVTLRRERDLVTIAWSTVPRATDLTIRADAAGAVLLDKDGQPTRLAPEQDRYRLKLEPATANTVNGDPGTYLVGGSPALLVQET